MIIKVCGMRDADNIREVASLGVDMMGFIFCEESPRYVKMISSHAGIIPDYSEERLNAATSKSETDGQREPQKSVQRVGVFADEMPQTIVSRIYNYNLDFVQLHGDESSTMIENLKRTLIPDIAPHIKVIKTLHIASADDIAKYKDYEGVADMFLFDTKSEVGGGSGRHFDWSLLKAYDGATPFLLSGGIGPDDAEAISRLSHPKLAGIDLNSRFETAPGMKDVAALRRFIARLR